MPGRPLRKVQEAALALQLGGVGYYPESNFVHVDTGRVRRWLAEGDVRIAGTHRRGAVAQVEVELDIELDDLRIAHFRYGAALDITAGPLGRYAMNFTLRGVSRVRHGGQRAAAGR